MPSGVRQPGLNLALGNRKPIRPGMVGQYCCTFVETFCALSRHIKLGYKVLKLRKGQLSGLPMAVGD
jgi:hypothetical protein